MIDASDKKLGNKGSLDCLYTDLYFACVHERLNR